MARLVTNGAEAGVIDRFSGAAEVGFTLVASSGNGPTWETTNPRSGARHVRCNAIVAPPDYVSQQWTGVINRNYFARAWFYAATLPFSVPLTIARLATAGTERLEVRLNTDGTISAYYGNGGTLPLPTLLATSAQAISAGAYFCVELRILCNTSTTGQAEVRLNGTSIGSVSGVDLGTTAPIRVFLGNVVGDSVVLDIDDIAVNDDQGASQNSWPGRTGKIVLLKPVADTSRVGWVGGAGGTTNLFDAVNNYPPTGKAAASSADTDQIEDAAKNITDTYVAACEAYSASVASGGGGIGASDTVRVLVPITNIANVSAASARSIGFRQESNPGPGTEALIDTPAGIAGTWQSNWQKGEAAPVYDPAVTLATRPGLRVRKNANVTDNLGVSMMGLYVEYDPAIPLGLPELNMPPRRAP